MSWWSLWLACNLEPVEPPAASPARVGAPGVFHLIDPSTELPEHAAVGDLDADGDLDVLLAVSDGRVTRFENLGGGSFAPPEIVFVLSGASAVALADVDLDGDLDAIVTGYFEVVWLENQGGTFGPPVVVGTDGSIGVAVGDLDGDGDADLVTANISDGVSVHLNVGGAFAAEVEPLDLGDDYTFAVHLADLDGDGDLDLVSGDDTSLRVCENDGGTFVTCVTAADDGLGSVRALATTDLDGDGDRDLVQGDVIRVTTLENLGGFSFGAEQPVVDLFAPTSLDAVDLDGDADGDLLLAAQEGEVVWLAQSAGTFGPMQSLAQGARDAADAVASDLDGDGDLDVFTSTDRPGWVEALGAGQFAAEVPLAAAAVYSVLCADLDGDGAPDLATRPSPATGSRGTRTSAGGSASSRRSAPSTTARAPSTSATSMVTRSST